MSSRSSWTDNKQLLLLVAGGAAVAACSLAALFFWMRSPPRSDGDSSRCQSAAGENAAAADDLADDFSAFASHRAECGKISTAVERLRDGASPTSSSRARERLALEERITAALIKIDSVVVCADADKLERRGLIQQLTELSSALRQM